MILANFVRNKLAEFKSNYPTKKAGGLMVKFSQLQIWVRALAGYIALCSWARHLTLTVRLSTRCTCVQMGTGEFNAGGNPVID